MPLHFISGLPRSGSTLLAAILRQNSHFVAGMTSPVAALFRAVEDATSGRIETSVFVTDRQRDDLLRGLFASYYNERDGRTVFDTNRMWCARLPVLIRLFPDAKIIACVREVGWIADSFERLYRRNGQKPSALDGWDTAGTVYTRTVGKAASSGVIGFALDALREAVASEENERLLLLDYESLCRDPHAALHKLYDFIGERRFQHNFSHVEYEAGEFDRQLGAEGLHTVEGAVEWRPRKTILPPDLFARFANDNFWREPCQGS